MFKSFTCFLKCAYVEAIRKMINPQALSQFLTVLECVLINSRRQVISETHGILKTQLPCYKQTEREMLAISNSGIAPEFLSPESRALGLLRAVSAGALVSPVLYQVAFPSQPCCSSDVEVKNCIWPAPDWLRGFLYSPCM